MWMKPHRRRLRGLGLVELMVGITVGLIVAAGASWVAVSQINEHRRLMLETLVQQDLRTAADLLRQEMRRAGFRGRVDLGIWAPAKAVGSLKEADARIASANPYAALTITVDAATGTVVRYLYARQDPVTHAYGPTGTPASHEQFGFRWDRSSGVLYMQLGVGSDGQPNWQPITDPDNLQITEFQVVEEAGLSVSLGGFCAQPCDQPGTPSCPSQKVRKVNFKIVGQARHDPKVIRTLTGSERIRAEAVTGACP